MECPGFYTLKTPMVVIPTFLSLPLVTPVTLHPSGTLLRNLIHPNLVPNFTPTNTGSNRGYTTHEKDTGRGTEGY